MDKISFSEALDAVKNGFSIQRSGWNGKGLLVKMFLPDVNSDMTLPYLFIEYPKDSKNPSIRCPWLASQSDIMSEDWIIIDE